MSAVAKRCAHCSERDAELLVARGKFNLRLRAISRMMAARSMEPKTK
jgi:hypothetical protein